MCHPWRCFLLAIGVSAAGHDAALRERVFSVLDFGATCDGKTLDTIAIAQAVAAAAAVSAKADGEWGIVQVPAGRTCFTAPFNLTSNMTLRVDGTLTASDDPSLWPIIAPLPSYGRGRDHAGGRRAAFVGLYSLEGTRIEGAGTLDGNGLRWWEAHLNKTESVTRGHLVEAVESRRIAIRGVTLLNSPFWTVHLASCSSVHVKGIRVLAPRDSPNTDGIDPDSSSDVVIEDCFISNGDDCIAIKSGWDCFGVGYARPTYNVYIRNLTCTGNHGAGGLSIGSEMSGGVRNVTMVDSHFFDIGGPAVNIKSSKFRGGFVHDVLIQNLSVNGSNAYRGDSAMLRISDTYRSPNPSCGRHPAEDLPQLGGITFRDVSGFASQLDAHAVTLEGLTQEPIDGVTFERVSLKAGPWICDAVKNIHARDVTPPACDVHANATASVLDDAGMSGDAFVV